MAKNTEPNTYDLPFEIQRMYHHLMNSREDFSKRLTPAESRWLATLYEQLTAAWNRNNIDGLKNALELSYQELRRIQSELAKSSAEVEKIIEVELKRALQKRSHDLKQKKRQYERRLTDLKKDVQTWKDDIKQRELILKQRRTNYEASRSLRTKAQENLSQMRERLSVLSSRRKRISTANSKRADDYTEKKQALVRGLKNKSWPHLPSMADLSERERIASENLKREQEGNKKVLEQDKKRLSESLKQSEHDLLEQAWTRWVNQQQTLSEESKRYLTSEGRLLGLKKLKLNEKGLKEQEGAFYRVITKAGIDPDRFLEQYDAHFSSDRGEGEGPL